jgi:hypothetical protein
VLTLLTGSPYFPSGLYEFRTAANSFLDYEAGPSVPVNLQWATYFDLADSAGISRLWAGVHPPVDDVTGRRIGRVIGARAFEKASSYFSGKRTTGSGLLSAAPSDATTRQDDVTRKGVEDSR